MDFADDPVVKTSPSNSGGESSIPGWGSGIPHASQPKQNIKQEQYCNKFNKEFEKKMVHIKKSVKTGNKRHQKQVSSSVSSIK